MNKKLSNNPPKGTSDWWLPEFNKRQYIFNTWRRVNRQFGFEEYLTPILESADVYRAKSGEDVGGKELMTMTDRAGRELAIRPEMTPSVTRMVTRFYKQTPKPLRLFSIANFWRNERPQRGRNREFWQLNTDIFGSTSIYSDVEILQVALELMLAFNPPAESFVLQLNHRKLIDAILTDIAKVPANLITPTVRLLDKFQKLPMVKFEAALTQIGLTQPTIMALITFMECRDENQLVAVFPSLLENQGYLELKTIIRLLNKAGYTDWIAFNPAVIRGFDYYDGMVFEMFDNHPKNNRALFGGGRYNGLASLFGNETIPGIGFAPGDETTKLFLESWELFPADLDSTNRIYFPLFDESLAGQVNQIARELRSAGLEVEQGLSKQNMKQSLKYANKKGIPTVLIFGGNEAAQETITVKQMKTGDQTSVALNELVSALQAA
ncbi:MAG: histidine--tRNA ligase [Chloroflexi bacterium]|nr:histidine--tRNA ligase [Chloroflexota bacterium]